MERLRFSQGNCPYAVYMRFIKHNFHNDIACADDLQNVAARDGTELLV
jgi:hypothetical protein